MNLAIDIGGTKMLIGFKEESEYIFKRVETGKEITIDVINSYIDEFIHTYDIEVDTVNIAIPGLIRNGIIEACDVIPNLQGLSSRDFYNGVGVRLINDIDGALNFFRYLYKDIKSFVVIMIGTGIGMSIIVDGKPLGESRSFCGELGYSTVITPWGPDKLDNISSGAAIIERGGNNESIILASTYMGYALNNIITTLSPEKIIVGGGTLNYSGYFENMVEVCDKNTLPLLYKETLIVKEEFTGESVIRGLLV